MAIESRGAPGLNYNAFKQRLHLAGSSEKQNGPLNLRLELLESFMEQPTVPGSSFVARPKPEFLPTKAGRQRKRQWEIEEERRLKEESDIWSVEPGTLTIVDLSCPFVDDGAAGALFDISLALFLEDRGSVGRVVALDEAHKVRLIFLYTYLENFNHDLK